MYRVLLLAVSLLDAIISLGFARVLVYETSMSSMTQYAHCVYVVGESTVKYCWRGTSVQVFETSSDDPRCFNGGQQWIFRDLKAANVSPSKVVSWSSGVERADDYAAYVYDGRSDLAMTSLCECLSAGTFGARCEFKLLDRSQTFDNAVESQFNDKRNDFAAMQRYGDILCYRPLFLCDSGLLCLDWRDVCDGQQQCMDGLDEENCDFIEFNECEENEYRCVNGFCIDQEYWLDGEPDCMDWTDEKSFDNGKECPGKAGSIECEDRLCVRQLWSCGDGQCIPGKERLGREKRSRERCHNMREFNHICETHPNIQLWTQPNGLCWNEPEYKDPFYPMSNGIEYCIYLLRCLLSDGFEYHCPCHRSNCTAMMNVDCRDAVYLYPNGRLFRTYFLTGYTWNVSSETRKPNAFYFDGRLKCRGYHGRINKSPSLTRDGLSEIDYFPIIDHFFCNHASVERNHSSPVKYPKSCWNGSRTLTNQPYAFFDACSESPECLSQYRIGDDRIDCDRLDDKYVKNQSFCGKLVKHRFRCSNEQLTCLPVSALGDRWEDCHNKNDEFTDESGQSIHQIKCKSRSDVGCKQLKEYVARSRSTGMQDGKDEDRFAHVPLPFPLYCDSFWNLKGNFDELPANCKNWTCHHEQYQCHTGQCIELEWVCDVEWDCPDASDEQAIDIYSARTERNARLSNYKARRGKCLERHGRPQPFPDKCNSNTEYPCYRANVTDPLNIERYRPCINLTQIGDGMEDCDGGIDEKNTARNCLGDMLGFTLRCPNGGCLEYDSACEKGYEWCPNAGLCSYRGNETNCSGVRDVRCLDQSCRLNASCNGIPECPHGEDELWCPFEEQLVRNHVYRFNKQVQNPTRPILWPVFPSGNSSQSVDTQRRERANESDSFRCNRGIAVAFGNQFDGRLCLCPQAYYGDRCEFFSERISIITHLDLSTFRASNSTNSSHWFKIVASLLYQQTVVDFHEFNVNGEQEREHFVKQKFHLLYSSSSQTNQSRRLRYFNRTDIILNRPYSVRFVVFALNINGTKEMGSWMHPIYFDYIPVTRLATVLKFPPWYGNGSSDPCSSHSACPSNSVCLPIFNSKSVKFYCSCKNGFYGIGCSLFQPQCSSYCSPDALCWPEGRGTLTNTTHPLCICPLHRFGPRCSLRHNECDSRPCVNAGTCQLRSDPSGQRSFICTCPSDSSGDLCEKSVFNVRIALDAELNAAVSVVQFYHVNAYSLHLELDHQRVTKGIPSFIRYNHDEVPMPPLAVLKLYDRRGMPTYYILYIQPDRHTVNITSTPEPCAHAASLPLLQPYPPKTRVFNYHAVCRNTTQLCFHDARYLCICEENRTRVDCFVWNTTSDRCTRCFAGGICIQGDPEVKSDFQCVCPQCSYGDRCEFTTHALGFTLDFLLATDSSFVRILYTSVAALLFAIGIFNNLCSYFTFKRPQPRKISVGNYLLFVSIVNQCALCILLLKFVHIMNVFKDSDILDLLSCKIIDYLLFTFTRATFWLTSWITCTRLQIILYPTSRLFKNARIAVQLTSGTMIALGLMHVPDLLFTSMFMDSCILNVDNPHISTYIRVNTLFNYLAPFVIQTIGITSVIVLAARSRSNATGRNQTFRQVFSKMLRTQKELYMTPAIIIVSALPQTVLSFSLACSQPSPWQSHLLLSAYLLSYTPQVSGFVLFVLPSQGYRRELKATRIGQTRLLKWILDAGVSQEGHSVVLSHFRPAAYAVTRAAMSRTNRVQGGQSSPTRLD